MTMGGVRSSHRCDVQALLKSGFHHGTIQTSDNPRTSSIVERVRLHGSMHIPVGILTLFGMALSQEGRCTNEKILRNLCNGIFGPITSAHSSFQDKIETFLAMELQ